MLHLEQQLQKRASTNEHTHHGRKKNRSMKKTTKSLPLDTSGYQCMMNTQLDQNGTLEKKGNTLYFMKMKNYACE